MGTRARREWKWKCRRKKSLRRLQKSRRQCQHQHNHCFRLPRLFRKGLRLFQLRDRARLLLKVGSSPLLPSLRSVSEAKRLGLVRIAMLRQLQQLPRYPLDLSSNQQAQSPQRLPSRRVLLQRSCRVCWTIQLKNPGRPIKLNQGHR